MGSKTTIAISLATVFFGVIALIWFTGYSSDNIENVPSLSNENQIILEEYEAELEKQRKIDSLIASDSYSDNPMAEYWDRAKLETIQTDDDTAFNVCVDSIVGKYFSPSTAEEMYQLNKAQMVCSHLKP